MRYAAFVLVPAVLLAACGSNGQEAEQAPDTSYEQQLPSPVEQTGEDAAPAQRNDTVAGGADERVDEIVAEEVNQQPAEARPAGMETGGSTTTR